MPELSGIQEIASLPIALVAIVLMYRLASNHMHRLADAIDALREYLIRSEKNRE